MWIDKEGIKNKIGRWMYIRIERKRGRKRKIDCVSE